MSVDAAASDRLPWLSDEPAPQLVRPRRGTMLPWALAAFVLVAGGGFWIGSTSGDEALRSVAPRHQPSTTIVLPPPRQATPEVRIAPEPEVRQAPVPEVRSAPERQVHIAPPPVQRPAAREPVKAEVAVKPEPAATLPQPTVVVQPRPQAAPQFAPLTPWNPRVLTGAAGRVVQIGAFGSVHQAKLGWRFMARAYPAMTHLPAVVRDTRNSRGRTFYRFQVGTTSQAHSEVLCQRMRAISFSCAVVDLPWKAKVER